MPDTEHTTDDIPRRHKISTPREAQPPPPGGRKHAVSKLRDMIEKGSNVIGTTATAALSVATGSPEVSVALAAIGATGIYQRIGTEMAGRWLAPREQARVGGVIALSAEVLRQKLDQGRTLRNDGFFDTPPNGRSDAEEVIEGVLRSAQTEYEERKLPYLARLWSNACLDEAFGAAKLNYLLKLTEQLTYRQLSIIAIAGAMAKASHANIYELRSRHYENTGLNMLSETAIVLSEIVALHNLNCVEVIAPLGPVQVAPAKMRIANHGAVLYNAMELHQMPSTELQPVIELLK